MKSRSKPTNWAILCVFGLVIAVGTLTLSYLIFSAGILDLSNTPRNSASPDDAIPDQAGVVFLTRSGEPVNTIADLENFKRFDSVFERTLALRTLISDADEETLQQFLEESKNLNSVSLKDEVQDSIVQRIAINNPRSALKTVDELPSERRNALMSIVFQAWSGSNLEEAIKHAQTLDEQTRKYAIESVVKARDDLSVDELRAIARQLGGEWIALKVLAQKRTHNELIPHPKSEWNAFVQNNEKRVHDFDEAQSTMFSFIIRSWIEQDGLEAVDTLLESTPRQWPMMQPWTTVLDELMETDIQLALDLAVRVREITHRHHKLAEHVLERWTMSNPQAALDATFAIEAPTFRNRLQRQVFKTWSESDPYTLANSIGNFRADLQDRARWWSATEITKTSPQMAVEIVGEISDRDYREFATEWIVGEWAKHDIAQTLDWIQSDPRASHIQDSLEQSAFRQLARHDPQLALETALNMPINSGEAGLEAKMIGWLADTDLDKAVAMLPFARKGETQFRAYDEVIQSSLSHGDSERAMELFLEQSEIGDANRLGTWALDYLVWDAPRRLYASLEKLPPGEWQAESARTLLRYHRGKNTFTSEQLSNLRAIFQSQRGQLDASQLESIKRRERIEAFRDILNED